MTSRQKILENISKSTAKRQSACFDTTYSNEDIYKAIDGDALSCFKSELEAISGKCFIVDANEELLAKLKQELERRDISQVFCKEKPIAELLAAVGINTTNQASDFEMMQCGITSCEFLIARTGSVLVTSNDASGRQMNVFPPIHIILASSSQLLNFPEDGLIALQQKYGNALPSTITTITGPSRTADIEKTLVLGAHGPKELLVFVVKE